MIERQRSRWGSGLTWALAAGCLLLLPTGLLAQQPVGMSASLVPDLVTVRVTLPSGKTFQATAWEGDALTFRSETLGLNLALVSRVEDGVLGDVTIDLYRLQDDGPVTRIIGKAERIDARRGLRSVATSQLDVEVVEIRQATVQELKGYLDRNTTRIDPAEGLVFRESGCCVSCDGDQACGCRVLSVCGGCCGGCCGPLAK